LSETGPVRRNGRPCKGIGVSTEQGDGPRTCELPELPTVRAVEFIRRMRGASQPCLMRGEDGHVYVVKFQNNPQHIRVLANELLANRLGCLMGLPIPEAAIVEVPAELVASNPDLEIQVGVRRIPIAPGPQFGSCFPGEPSRTLVVDFLPDRLLRRVRNLHELFLGAYVFDKWTCNCDGRQVVFYRSVDDEDSTYSAWLIDHGFCFNDGEWNFPDHKLRGFYPRRLVYESVRSLDAFDRFLRRLENLEQAQLEACAREIPPEWCGGDPEQLARLLERLYERRRKVRQFIIEARDCDLRPFPNWV